MNIEETATYLFVSHYHVRQLLARGEIIGTPGENGDYLIDEASVENYRMERKHAARKYFDSQTEDSAPLGMEDPNLP